MCATKIPGRFVDEQSRILRVFTGQAKLWSGVDYAGCLSGSDLCGIVRLDSGTDCGTHQRQGREMAKLTVAPLTDSIGKRGGAVW